MQKVLRSDWPRMAEMYEVELVPMIAIAKQYGCSRLRVWQILNVMGVDTTKHKITVSCTTCGNALERVKSQIRKNKHLFCDFDCYTVWLNRGHSIMWRQGQRLGRAEVSKYYELKEGNVVHHKDGNDHNCLPENLMVFANQGDHLRHHRDFEVVPLWDGAVNPLHRLALTS